MATAASAIPRSAAPPPEALRRICAAVLLSLALHALIVVGMRFEPGAPGSVSALRARLVPVSTPGPEAIEPPSLSEPARDLKTAAPGERVVETAPDEPPPSARATERASGAEAAAFALPVYYNNREVDVRAAPRDIGNRSRSERAMALGRIVRVKLQLFISDAGTVDRFELLEIAGPAEAFDPEEVREMRFYPAMKNGVPVRSRKTVELSFVP